MTLSALIILALIGIFAIFLSKVHVSIKSHWQTFFDGYQLSANELYALVKDGLKERQITHVDIAYTSFLEKHIFSAKREYLRIMQDEYVFYVCAAPYGTGTFVSSWLCVKDDSLSNRIPILSKLAGKDRSNKTFYQMDTEAMFQSAVHTTILAAIDSMTNAKGIRGLSELQRQFKDIR